jgi:hypothetical protein
MASADEKWKGEPRDRRVMASNANGAEGEEGKTEETNLSVLKWTRVGAHDSSLEPDWHVGTCEAKLTSDGKELHVL